MNTEMTITRNEKQLPKIRIVAFLAGIIAVALLIAGVLVSANDHGRVAQPFVTLDQIDPCQPYQLGSQLSPSVEMELEERCARQENSIPAQ